MDQHLPTHLERTKDRHLRIEWDDGLEQVISLKMLRDHCPCATCMQKRANPPETPKGSLPILSAEEAQPLEIESMKPVGNYAYNIQFNDGHSTGIFTFELLRAIV